MKSLVVALVVLLSSQITVALDRPFSQVAETPRKILIMKMAASIPAYIAATEGVLREIDALPAGTITEQTELDELPIADIFKRNSQPLRESAEFGDIDFIGGRRDHDVAWLRQSLVELKETLRLVKLEAAGKSVATQLDPLVHVVSHSMNHDQETHIILQATSRFYCNVEFRVYNEGNSRIITADEYCD